MTDERLKEIRELVENVDGGCSSPVKRELLAEVDRLRALPPGPVEGLVRALEAINACLEGEHDEPDFACCKARRALAVARRHLAARPGDVVPTHPRHCGRCLLPLADCGCRCTCRHLWLEHPMGNRCNNHLRCLCQGFKLATYDVTTEAPCDYNCPGCDYCQKERPPTTDGKGGRP